MYGNVSTLQVPIITSLDFFVNTIPVIFTVLLVFTVLGIIFRVLYRHKSLVEEIEDDKEVEERTSYTIKERTVIKPNVEVNKILSYEEPNKIDIYKPIL